VNYTASLSPNGYAIVAYNISLYYANGTLITLLAENGVNLGYVIDINSLNDSSNLQIRVRACDNQSQCSTGLSETFSVNKIPSFSAITATTPVDPVESSTVLVNSSLNITDGDLDIVTCRIAYPNTTVKTMKIATETPYSPTLTGINCSFGLQYYEPAGNYTIYFEANDSVGNLGLNETTIIYNSLTASSFSTASINFGSLQAGKTSNKTFDITNTGNTMLASSINGTNLTGTSYSIDVSNMRFDNESTYTNSIAMTTSYQYLMNITTQETKTAYISLTIPSVTPNDVYSGKISVRIV
jgi:hypothetical protein